MSFEEWQRQNAAMAEKPSGFEAWQVENERLGITPIEPRGLPSEFGAALGRGAMTVGKGLLGTARDFSPLFGKMSPLYAAGVTEPVEQIGKAMERVESARGKLAPTREDWAGWATNVIGEAIPYMGAALTGGAAAGLAGAGMVGFATEGQLAYEEAKEKGASETEAQTDRVVVGSINAAIEALQIGRLMKFHKAGKGSLKGIISAARNKAWKEMGKQGVGFSAEILKTSVEEGLEEALQEGVSIAVPGLTRGEVPRRPDGSIDSDAIAKRIGGAALGGAVAGGVLGGGGAAVGFGVEAAKPSVERIEAAAKRVQESKLSDFEKARALEELRELGGFEEQLGLEEEPVGVPEVTQPAPTVKEKAKAPAPAAKTGEPYSATLYRGTSAATPVDEGMYGKGTYYTSDKNYAANYGEVVTQNVTLQNPYVTKDVFVLEELARPALEKAIAQGKSALEINEIRAQTIRDILESKGHDGIVILEGATGGQQEVIVFDTEKSVVAAPETPAPAAKEPWQMMREHILEANPYGYSSSIPNVTQITETQIEELSKDYPGGATAIAKEKQKITQAILESHKKDVQLALAENKPVPRNVLEEYKGEKWADEALAAPPAIKKPAKIPGVVQQDRAKGLFEISESAKRRMATAKKFENVLTELEAKRPELKKGTRERIGEKLEEMKRIFEDPAIADDPEIASRVAKSTMQGFAREQIPELTEKISRDEANDLLQAVREADMPRGQLASLMTFFEAVKAGVQPHRSHIKIFDKFFGTNITKKTPKRKLTKTGKLFSIAAEPFNLVKAIVCSCDFSAGGIQALMVAPNNPVLWGKGVGTGYRAFFSPEYVNLTELEMRTHPYFQTIQEFEPNLITEVGSKTKGEEFFVSELAHRIPLVGKLVRASDRAFVTTLNYIRSHKFYQWMEQNPGASNEAIKEILDHIGNITGRGTGKPGGKFEKYAPELGAILWAPRLYLGTVKSMTDWATKPHIRKLAAGNLVQATGFLLGILGLISLDPDNEVELDPRSTDFLKIKRGNTRISFFGRHTQMIRTVAQMIMGQKKATSTGRVHSRQRTKIAAQFLRSKLHPMAGAVWDVATGKTFLGEKMRTEPEFIQKYIYEHITPMFLQDVADAIRYQGLGTAIWASPLGVHGIGLQTYEIQAGGESTRLKNHYAHQFFGADWDELGPDTQNALRENQPLIEIYEDRARRERGKYAYEDWAQAEQREAGRKVVKGLSKDIQTEFDRLEFHFGGLSRRISSNWFLNKKRYEQYQEQTKQLVNRTVPNLIKAPGWDNLSPEIQRNMLDEMVKECKKVVRQKIVSEAKFSDLERVTEGAGY